MATAKTSSVIQKTLVCSTTAALGNVRGQISAISGINYFSARVLFFFLGGPVRWRVDLPDCAKFGVLLARAAWLCQSLYLLLAACLEYLSLQLTTWSLLYQSRLRDILKLHNAFAACCDRGRNSRLLYSACLWRATPS